jgi:urease accessory protein
MTLPFAATSPSEPLPELTEGAAAPRFERTEGAARIAFKFSDGATRLDRLHQSGAAKVRIPHRPAEHPPEAVLINTAGGLTGGDRMSAEIRLDAGCHAVATTQACEKVYRASSGTAEIHTALTLGVGARLDWLPQETILFDGARLSRRLDADLAPDAEVLLVEAVIFGRAARGERVRSGLFADRWRVRRKGRLVFADDLRFDWADADLLSKPAVLAGAGAMATVLLVTEEPARYLSAAREIVGEAGGVSTWAGKLVARLATPTGFALRRTLIPLLAVLRDGAPLPKLWRI